MRYKVEGEIFDDYEDAIEYCIDEDYHEDDDYFEEWVNDCYGHIEIYGQVFYAYNILNEMNDSILDDLRADYCRNENETDRENGEYELRNAEIGDEVYVQNYTIEVIEDEETGDYDGDEIINEEAVAQKRIETIDAVRVYIEEQNLIKEQVAAENKKAEDDMMSLFQVIK